MTINCLGNLIALDTPRVMGILNLTPDSFFDGGKYREEDAILEQVGKMIGEGATFIDVGAYSSRPNAEDISEAEELARLLPVVELLLGHFPDILLSIDTFRSEVASRCLDMGAAMINDISASGLDPGMMATVASYRVPYVIMHMKGNPRDMTSHAEYKDLMGEILFYFSEKIAQGRALGVSDILVDPGFGFAKTIEQNYELLQQLEQFQLFGLPLLVGLSRKSMIYKLLETKAGNALNGSTALHMVALAKGARILRVHDVREAMECIKLQAALEKKY
jgi:dihydropteroate synthase